MAALQPKDVPQNGRYQFEVIAVGVERNTKRGMIKVVITDGKHRWKRLTSFVDDPEEFSVGEQLTADLEPKVQAKVGGKWEEVDVAVKDVNPRIRYYLSDFEYSEQQKDITFNDPRAKFKRTI